MKLFKHTLLALFKHTLLALCFYLLFFNYLPKAFSDKVVGIAQRGSARTIEQVPGKIFNSGVFDENRMYHPDEVSPKFEDSVSGCIATIDKNINSCACVNEVGEIIDKIDYHACMDRAEGVNGRVYSF